MSIDRRDLSVTRVYCTRRLLRRPRWTVEVTHLPSGIAGAGLDRLTFAEARDGAIHRIESMLRRMEELT